ncbi:hypothetical protein P7K49_011736, partial [Saguinus oedipus]
AAPLLVSVVGVLGSQHQGKSTLQDPGEVRQKVSKTHQENIMEGQATDELGNNVAIGSHGHRNDA